MAGVGGGTPAPRALAFGSHGRGRQGKVLVCHSFSAALAFIFDTVLFLSANVVWFRGADPLFIFTSLDPGDSLALHDAVTAHTEKDRHR